MEWKLKPGCTLKKAILFHTGSAKAVGTTSGWWGVPAAARARGQGAGRRREGKAGGAGAAVCGRQAGWRATQGCLAVSATGSAPPLLHLCPEGRAPARRRPLPSRGCRGLQHQGGPRWARSACALRLPPPGVVCTRPEAAANASLLRAASAASAATSTTESPSPPAHSAHQPHQARPPTHPRPTREVDDVGDAAVANHVVVAQQVPPSGVHVAGAVGLIRQLAAACARERRRLRLQSQETRATPSGHGPATLAAIPVCTCPHACHRGHLSPTPPTHP